MTLLSVSDFSVRLRGRDTLNSLSFDIGAGEFVGLIGPNGAGKTTLMRAALGLLPFKGQSSLAALPENLRAKQVAWMPQAREIAWPVTVEKVVMLGRLPHLTSAQKPSATDHAKVDAALAQMELGPMRHRSATHLSGGEQARVLIARALAQDTPLLVADEPVAGLDPAHQIATMQTFKALADQGRSSLVSLHDLGLAARHCTRLIMLQDGKLVANGPPEEVLSPERLAQVFGITAWFEHTDQGPVYQPLEVIR
ncbi:ABC transporter ATP-binding protein [Rhodobacteraceae bacterium D3-12]|nr:ABC transporter ATP-binding protein [Rhodobacteraceae bacterium D3-12]